MYIQVSTQYPTRIAFYLEGLNGPLTSATLGAFDPNRDLLIFVDGIPQKLQSWSFDLNNNRYLLFTETNIDMEGIIQVVHHMPSPPFTGTVSASLGFGTAFGTSFGS